MAGLDREPPGRHSISRLWHAGGVPLRAAALSLADGRGKTKNNNNTYIVKDLHSDLVLPQAHHKIGGLYVWILTEGQMLGNFIKLNPGKAKLLRQFHRYIFIYFSVPNREGVW